MKILAWNCRSLGNTAAVLALLDVIRRFNPDVVFLSETHLDKHPAECLRRRMKLDVNIIQPSDGRRGGLVMMWKKEVKLHQIYACPNYIDVRIEEENNKIWRFTGMYGEFRWADKYKTWDRLRSIHQQNNLPWLIMGDLNEILYVHEKEGGNVRPERFREAFHNALDDCNLVDFGYIGDPFTWHRGTMRERLDRGLVNTEWLAMQDHAAIQHLEYNHSDHRPLLLDTEFYAPQTSSVTKQFHFEAKWLKEEKFRQVVEEQWMAAANEPGVIDVLGRLKAMHAGLHAWDYRVLKKPKQQLRKAQRELDMIMRGPINDMNQDKKN
jgi:exonuclease III